MVTSRVPVFWFHAHFIVIQYRYTSYAIECSGIISNVPRGYKLRSVKISLIIAPKHRFPLRPEELRERYKNIVLVLL